VFDLKSLERPKTPEEAVRALLETEGTGLYVAGGTIVVPTGSPSLDYLVDLTSAGLGHLRTDRAEDGSDVLVVGAMTRIADLEAADAVETPTWRAVGEAAASVATHTVRNRATVGGNISAAHYPSDLPPAFLALDSTVVLLGRDGSREVSLEDLYTRRAEVYTKGDLITEVRVPSVPAGLASAFEKAGRMRVDVAMVNCAVALVAEGDTIVHARIALNGVTARPVVASEAASLLTGKKVSAELFAQVGESVSAGLTPRDDHRAGAEYRKKVAGVLARRALARAAGLTK
jgi:CO/xanthine dehydrogenase FAD-binding subunit